DVRHGAAARGRDEGRRLAHAGTRDGVQAAPSGGRPLAVSRRRRARPARPRRRVFRGWSADRVAEEAEEGRRLISLNPQLLTIALPTGTGRARRRMLHSGRVEGRALAPLVIPRELQIVA